MTYNKQARIAELKAMPREELEALASKHFNLTRKLHSKLRLAQMIEEREFSDLRTAAKLPRIRDIF